MKLNHLYITLSIPLYLITTPTFSAGFAISENSASGLGNAFAGAAATGADASTVWFNPAAMSLLEDQAQISIAGHIINAKSEFTDSGSAISPAIPVGSLSGNNANGGKAALVPNFYFSKPINDRVKFGLGINAPYGLEVTYDDDWVGRYQGTKSEMKTVNINPALSWKVNDKVALGMGLNVQYVDVTLGSAIDSVAACFSAGGGGACLAIDPTGAGNPNNDSKSEMTGDDISFGYNLGALFSPSNKTRVGVSYRSQIKHNLEGDIKFALTPALTGIIGTPASLTSRDITAAIDLPETLSASVSHKVNKKLELLGDITWTGWSSFEKLTVNDTSGTLVTNTDENWKNVYRISLGGNYRYNNRLMLRAGAAFDESPVPNAEHRTVRLPGNDRTWLSVGAGYKVNKHASIDIGYSHILVKDGDINHTNERNYLVKGSYDSGVDILSAQLNWKF